MHPALRAAYEAREVRARTLQDRAARLRALTEDDLLDEVAFAFYREEPEFAGALRAATRLLELAPEHAADVTHIVMRPEKLRRTMVVVYWQGDSGAGTSCQTFDRAEMLAAWEDA